MRLYRSTGFLGFARRASKALGHPASFVIAVTVVLVWALSGPLLGFSETWQLTINTATTIITFLMVFLIQNTQNHDAAVQQLKLDELIRCTENAHTALLDLDELSEAELEQLYERYRKLAEKARRQLRERGTDFGAPEIDVH